MPRCVIIEIPFSADPPYIEAVIKDCLDRGEAPYLSVLPNEEDPISRGRAIAAHFAWRLKADATVVYDDLGISTPMRMGIDDAIQRNLVVEYRSLGRLT